MRSRTEPRSRGPISESVDRTEEDLQNRAAELRADVELVRQAVENMDFSGTPAAIQAMENALHSSDRPVIDTTERQSEGPGDVQADDAEHGEEFRERFDADRSDRVWDIALPDPQHSLWSLLDCVVTECSGSTNT